MYQSLDISTLRLCSTLASLASGFVFLGLWHRQRSSAYLLYWAASSLIYALVIVAFQASMSGSLLVSTSIFVVMGSTDVLLISGLRSLDGRRPFAAWMLVPALAAAAGNAIPHLLATYCAIGGPLSIDLGDMLGLSGSVGLTGAAILFDRDGKPLTRARFLAGMALLAYLPGYAGAMVVRLGFIPSHEMLAVLPMLSDQLLLGVLNLALLAIPVERAHAQLRDLALRDHLTGVWNRAGLAAQFARFGKHGATLIAIDVDHFKSVNDQHGHAAGDDILIALARRASMLVAEMGGEVARIGGDEFIAILPKPGLDEARTFAARLGAHGDDSWKLPRWTVSIGLAAIEPGATDIGPALKQADISLYRAKALGRNRVAA
ncbi:diguanylate cyclase [Sphingomonas sp. MMS24-J13]|uniref:GGDEF domain-containing protein n=1 Tax=Sphingomonas sp. MMS24-J13 TaxID=3238686 RepID=UPI00384E8753